MSPLLLSIIWMNICIHSIIYMYILCYVGNMQFLIIKFFSSNFLSYYQQYFFSQKQTFSNHYFAENPDFCNSWINITLFCSFSHFLWTVYLLWNNKHSLSWHCDRYREKIQKKISMNTKISRPYYPLTKDLAQISWSLIPCLTAKIQIRSI